MSIANDFMNIDFDSAADVDIGSLDDDLDIMGGYDPVAALGLNMDHQKTSKAIKQEDFKVEKEMVGKFLHAFHMDSFITEFPLQEQMV